MWEGGGHNLTDFKGEEGKGKGKTAGGEGANHDFLL